MQRKKLPEDLGVSPGQISAVMKELGRRGGSKRVPKGFAMMTEEQMKEVAAKSAKARKRNLTPEQRKEIARKAAAKRWGRDLEADKEGNK